jgi:hypothetical protein
MLFLFLADFEDADCEVDVFSEGRLEGASL